jgi:hypothetical protein
MLSPTLNKDICRLLSLDTSQKGQMALRVVVLLYSFLFLFLSTFARRVEPQLSVVSLENCAKSEVVPSLMQFYRQGTSTSDYLMHNR